MDDMIIAGYVNILSRVSRLSLQHNDLSLCVLAQQIWAALLRR